eukprot:TRINITY_DN5732_c0_g1_i1.p1 TRINITY_DN5732_c0_g1~~TRINITY_DN5732_c0_g1_i1.p1  ORF type:complete len:692 (-),score=164.07 TRINITY_DN5732_c0_g1_i1:116-1927(-)
MDEFYPMTRKQLQSYYYYMHSNFFEHIDIDPKNIHIPNGEVPKSELPEYLQKYEDLIQSYGIDIQIVGVSGSGQIGFNEPGCSKLSRTRLVHLDRRTKKEVESSFFNSDSVPDAALTMGVASILSAKRIFLLGFGEHKAKIMKKIIEDAASTEIVGTYLQSHENVEAVLDTAAGRGLTRVTAPWVVIPNSSAFKLTWDSTLTTRAVIWLSLKLNKSLLRLREEDYFNNNLEQLIDARGSAHTINLEVFNHLKQTITGWPGGKIKGDILTMSPDARKSQLGLSNPHGSTTRNPTDYIVHNTQMNTAINPRVDQSIYPKTILVFSPHPDDDVISMGGTLIRLVEQGHKVHVAYQTSGNIAVWDDDVKRFANFATRYAQLFGIDASQFSKLEDEVEDYISDKKNGDADSVQIRKIKGLIRETEATSAARYCGVKKNDIHFLNMPFYETGKSKKSPVGKEDVDIITKLLRDLKPHQIYAAGDLTDPHGTHRLCLKAIMMSLKEVRNDDWFKKCQIWLYRGAWQEWEPHEIQMAIPMSPTELLQKRYAIYKHQSQKDPAPFPGSDSREFWQRSEARNRETAHMYDVLGLTEYEAMEAFVHYDLDSNVY